MQRHRLLFKTAAALAVAAACLTGCNTTTTAGKSENSASHAEIDDGVSATLSRLYTQVNESRELVSKADGVLVFRASLQQASVSADSTAKAPCA